MTAPAWLEAMIDQRVALMKDEMSKALGSPGDVVMTGLMAMQPIGMITTPLTEPREGATTEEYEVWDQSCDGCKKYVPGALYSGHAIRELWGKQLIITFGVCGDCKEKP